MKHQLAIALLIPAVFAGAAANSTGNGPVTYTKDVAPILMNRCVNCHRTGEPAPMALTSYKEVRPWAKAIKTAVATKRMPVWLADPAHGKFANDRRLSEAEIATITAWVDAGAPEGDPKLMPPAPQFPGGWNIGKPDQVFDMGTDFTVPKEGVVAYQYFVVDPKFTEDKWVEAAEIRPQFRSAVHHVIVFLVPPGGAGNGRGAADEGNMNLLTGYGPGEQPLNLTPGYAKLIKAGTKFRFQLHYTPNGKEGQDRTIVAFRYAKQEPKMIAYTASAINFAFKIPANADNHEVKSSFTIKSDTDLIDFMPHMHVRGKAFQYSIVYPDGRREIALDVPKYDFNWQLQYVTDKPIHLPAGTRIECVAHFDNSPNNKANPNPNVEVKWGDQTWEEMMIGFFTLTKPFEKPAASQPTAEN